MGDTNRHGPPDRKFAGRTTRESLDQRIVQIGSFRERGPFGKRYDERYVAIGIYDSAMKSCDGIARTGARGTRSLSLLISGAARDRNLHAASSREILGSTNCSEAVRAVCFRILPEQPGTAGELSCSRNPIVIPACNFNQSPTSNPPPPFPPLDKFPTMLLAVLSSCYGIVGSRLYMRIVHGSRRAQRPSTPGTCDVVCGAPRVRSIIHRAIVRRSTSPAAYGTTSPAIGFPRLKERARSPPSLRRASVRFSCLTRTHRRYPMLDMCYNKSTILAPTRDDSIGLALFSESRVYASHLEHDAPVIVETSSACCSLPLIPLPSYRRAPLKRYDSYTYNRSISLSLSFSARAQLGKS